MQDNIRRRGEKCRGCLGRGGEQLGKMSVIKPVVWKKMAEYMRTMDKTGGCGWQETGVPRPNSATGTSGR